MKLTHVSASQVKSFQECPRKWFNRSIRKIRAPQTEAQQFGTQHHENVEHYYATGEIKTALVQAHLALLPPRDPNVFIEEEFNIPTYSGGPVWNGFIDMLDLRDPQAPRVLDHKTTKDFRYAKARHELLQDTQLMSYCKALYVEGERERDVEVSHVYVKKVGKPEAQIVSATATPANVNEVWTRDLETVKKMAQWAEQSDGMDLLVLNAADALPPNTESCDLYNGCEYRQLCGLSPPRSGGIDMSKLKEKMAAARAAGAGGAQGQPQVTNWDPAAQASAPPAVGVLPPDAPARTNPTFQVGQWLTWEGFTGELKKIDGLLGHLHGAGGAVAQVSLKECKLAAEKDIPAAAAPAAIVVVPAMGMPSRVVAAPPPPPFSSPPAPPAAEKRTRKKREAAPASGAVDNQEAAVGAQAQAGELLELRAALQDAQATIERLQAENMRLKQSGGGAPAQGLTLYMSSYPIKGPHREVIVLEDLLAPLQLRIAAEAGVADWDLLDYGKGAPALKAALREYLEKNPLPEAILSRGYSRADQAALEVLLPYAAHAVGKLG